MSDLINKLEEIAEDLRRYNIGLAKSKLGSLIFDLKKIREQNRFHIES